MPDWSIKIVPAESPTTDVPAAFVPDLSGAQPGTPLTAQVDDIVTWNNTTSDPHQPWPADANYNPLPDAQVLSLVLLPVGGPFPLAHAELELSVEIGVEELKAHVYRLASPEFQGRQGIGAARASRHLADTFETSRTVSPSHSSRGARATSATWRPTISDASDCSVETPTSGMFLA